MKQKTTNKWKTGTIVLAIAIIILIVYNLTIQPKIESNKEAKRLCELIKYTPAWVDYQGEIIHYGYIKKPKNTTSSIIKELLIPEKIKFLYDPKCSACHEQISDFGDNWDFYQKLGLTINCMEVLK